MALNHWKNENLLKKDGNATMRLQAKSNNFVIVDEYINHPKIQEQIAQSSFVKLDYDPKYVHIKFGW